VQDQVLQAELLRHGLLVLLGPDYLLRFERLCRPGDLLLRAALLLHGFGLVLLGSLELLCLQRLRRPRGFVLLGPGRVLLCTRCHLLRSAGKLLHASRHVLLGSRRQLLRSFGLMPTCES